jgi:hypothetical protein
MPDSQEIASPPRFHRSSVSNGSRLFAVKGMDGRTGTARRFRDLVETITLDLGGTDMLSEGQRQLIRRAAMLSVMCESVEADMVRNTAADLSNYSTLVNAQRRTFDAIGLERRARPVKSLVELLADEAPR